jgi:hypothetical protein
VLRGDPSERRVGEQEGDIRMKKLLSRALPAVFWLSSVLAIVLASGAPNKL